MATLTQPFGVLDIGNHSLQASLLGWMNIGSCDVTANSDFEFAASGTYNVLGHSGTFDMTLTLDDQNPASTTGPCTIVNSGSTLKGTYVQSGTTLTFSAEAHSVAASPDPGGVILAISGYPKARIAK